MRNVLVSSVLALVACGGSAPPDVSSASLTSAGAQDSVSDRIGRAVCIHEVECGRVREPELCVDATRARAGRELSAWTCDPESARVSAEQCLHAVRTASCAVDLSAQPDICPRNGGCATVERDPAASR